jgi:hypothetical protein
MGQMKTETLVRKMLQNPAAVREFLDACSPTHLAMWFPDHEIKLKMKEVTNLLSGIKVMIPANTPYHCDPSSEAYHSN